MKSFWFRLATVNGRWLAREFRRWADEAERFFPGSPEFGVLVFHEQDGVKMGMIQVEDTSAALNASVVFLDAEGHETTADDVPQWASDNTDAAVVTAAEDGMSATVEIGGPGAAIVSVSSTNTDGSTVQAQGTIEVRAGDAVIGEVTFEAPTA